MKSIIYFGYLALALSLTISCSNQEPKTAVEANKPAQIFPDYQGVTIPNNIAPLNFVIREKGDDFLVKITPKNGKKIFVSSPDGNIQIPFKAWKEMLKNNGNEKYEVDIYVKTSNSWNHFNTISNQIAPDAIDGYLMYRFINPANILWNEMGIYQRNIESFDVEPIMSNSLTDNNCMHCHSVAANNAENFMLHMRGKPGGTVIYSDNKLKFVDTKTPQTISPGGYPAWHPSGKIIAFTTNKISQKFHATKEKYAFVFDAVSDIELYFVDKNEIQAVPKLSTSDFENIPAWSPDGKYLYFISTPQHNPDTLNYEKIKYSLKRISYDTQTNTWGNVELLISADSIGKSITYPRVSPDNRYVVFTMADYGYFTVYTESADIALFDLELKQIIKPEINSTQVESYPSWSSEGKWIMFNSKRDDGLTSRPYFAWFNNGVVAKPFVLPQRNAMWNFEELNNINRPELVSSKIELTPQQILALVKTKPVAASFDVNSLKVESSNDTASNKGSNAFNFDQ